MTIHELKSKLNVFRQVKLLCILVLLILFVGFFGFLFFMGKYIERFGFNWISIASFLASLPIVAVAMVLALVFPERIMPFLGLTCPQCNKPVTGDYAVEAELVKTGRCKHCACQILNPWPPDTETPKESETSNAEH